MQSRFALPVFGLAALAATPVLAAESGAAKPGLPQLDISLIPAQLFWLAVTFGLLYCLMAFVALPRVKSTQDKRREIIDGELAAARAASEDAKAMMARADKALADARANALASMSDITAKAAQESALQQAKQQKEIGQRLHDGEMKIAATRMAAIKEIESTAGELARAIVDKLTGAAVAGR